MRGRAARCAGSRGGDAADAAIEAVGAGVGLRGLGRERVDVRGDDVCRAASRGGHGKHAGSPTDIRDPFWPVALAEQLVEGDEATLRRGVVAGSESKCRLDLETDEVRGNTLAIMTAVDDEAACADRGEAARTWAIQSFVPTGATLNSFAPCMVAMMASMVSSGRPSK